MLTQEHYKKFIPISNIQYSQFHQTLMLKHISQSIH